MVAQAAPDTPILRTRIVKKSRATFTTEENTRKIKANSDYYILRTTQIPAALVECGFLSNGAEEAKLNDDTYQEQMAWGIYCGILDYFAAKDGAGGLQLAEKRI